MDIEEQLDIFFIRKGGDLISSAACKTNFKLTNRFKEVDVFPHIPLTIQSIKSLKRESWNEGTRVIEIFSGKVCFRNCIVYGKIIGRGNDSKTRYNYVLDDGTGCLNVSIPRRMDDMQTIWKLENELTAIKKEMMTQNKNEIICSLRNLLFQTKKQIDHSNIASGAKVLLYGRPDHFRGQISLDVFCLADDSDTTRDVEIAFKDYLIDWYRINVL